MVYGYVRISTDKQCTDNQVYEIRQFALKKNMKIDGWVEEIASGSRKIYSRKLGKLFKVIKKGDCIITTELSRVGRNLMHIMNFLYLCMEKETVVYTTKENYELGNNLNSKILAFAFSLSAEIERNLISQRTKEALARKKQEGVILGRPKGRKSTNYKLSGKGAHIQKFLEERYTLGDICHKMKVSRNTLRVFMKEAGIIPAHINRE
ncbi:MAG: master DNA invertase Mpi family serine-type recombinase [Tannerellaceae bacterium]|jgi:DNA invertase Pin-like site-specific DNA recombinase|nr:master DNA invertase Mpi family serine-type recombinase [Tannerellaceae bacterium]